LNFLKSVRGIKTTLGTNFNNIKGYYTKRKFIVIDSDDWGTIRMSSSSVYNKLLKAGIGVDKCNYCKYDSLETQEDLSSLFELLLSYKDINNKPPVFTANVIVANPDFTKIVEGNFEKYFFEPVTETFNKFNSTARSFSFWQKGLSEGVFYPQLHGREHLNVNRWMDQLRKKSEESLLTFQNNMFGISTDITKEKRRSYMAALDFDSEDELLQIKEMLIDAQNLFYDYFKFKSHSFIAPNYTWSSRIEPFLQNVGIKFIQGIRVQQTPFAEKIKNVKHFTGQQNKHNQFYLVRNCFFEPSVMKNRVEAVQNCLNQIEAAFRWNKPSIISTHRLNYTGSLDETNRSTNLNLLKRLLDSILKKWPDVEFITSDKLGELIENKMLRND